MFFAACSSPDSSADSADDAAWRFSHDVGLIECFTRFYRQIPSDPRPSILIHNTD